MRYGKLIKVGIVLAGVLTNTFVLAAQDPVSVKLTSALTSPIVVGTATPTTYTLTNNMNLPFALTPTFTTNSAAYVVSSSTCNNVASKKQCQVIATYTPSSVSTPAPMLTVTYDTTRFSLTQTPTIVSTPAPGSLTLTLTTSSSMQIANGGYINLVSDMTTAQTYTITPSSAWQNASVTLTNGPTNDTGNIFFSTTCIGTVTTSCTVSFNTNVTHTPSESIPASIQALDFSDPTIQLTVSGSNLSSTLPSWKVAPAVGMFMQGGVVYWVGPNTGATTQPGYRQALVAAVKDVGDLINLNAWGPTTTSVPGAQYLGLFAGPSGAATGLTNTNAICSNIPPYATPCSTSYPAAAAAQSYRDGSHTDWFLPAGSPVSDQGYGYCNSTAGTPTITAAGELCELYNQRAIINATATKHAGSNFVTTCTGKVYNCIYWSSSEYAQGTGGAWYVSFGVGGQGNLIKAKQDSVRPVRAFNY